MRAWKSVRILADADVTGNALVMFLAQSSRLFHEAGFNGNLDRKSVQLEPLLPVACGLCVKVWPRLCSLRGESLYSTPDC